MRADEIQAYTALVDCLKWRKEYGTNDLKGVSITSQSLFVNLIVIAESELNRAMLEAGEFYFHGKDKVVWAMIHNGSFNNI